MKNNYNPYTVPENFFETNCDYAVLKFNRRRRSAIYGIAAVAVAVALFAVPKFVNSFDERNYETEVTASNLAGMYEYDIFLQVNF